MHKDEQFQQEQLNQQLHSTSQNEPDDDEYISFQLTDFTIYIKPDRLEHEICLGHKQRFDYELVPLHALKCRAQVEGRSFLFDGILTNGRLKRYVERVPFELLSLGNYEQIALHSVDDQLMIASKKSIKQNVWYQLGKPSSEYERYHTPFLWLADLAKHFIDYLSVHERVVLNDFREKFYHWLDDQHGWDITFREWLEQFGHSDFRTAIAANTEFLWKEAADSALAYHERNQKQPIWSEVDTKHLTMLKEETSREKKTVVTPFVFNVFRNMKWAHYMDSRTCCPSLGRTSRYRHTKSELDLSRGTSVHAASEDELGLDQQGDFTNGLPQPSFPPLSTEKVESAKPKHFSVGDVIALPPDATTKWKSQDDLWFAYVQSVKRTSSGSQLLGLLWLYRKSDTTCDNGRYPYSNELFFSDNCSCEEKATYSSDAVAKVPVSFFGSPSHSTAGYFVRQKYRTVPGQEAFVTLRQSDFKCWHQSPETNKSDLQLFMKRYAVGDTILVPEEVAGTTILEPVEIVSFEQRNSREAVQMRRLLRRRRDYQDEEAKPNELVYSDDVYEIPVERLVDEDQCRRCHIRFYALTDLQECKIPAPYSRDGTADAYYIIYRQVGSGTMRRLEPIAESSMISLKQGFDPLSAPSRPPLRGMDLYCGGGNFGRGLEEGGAVQNRWAVDWAKSALHTYRANLEDPDATELYYGSVNDYLAKAMQGSTAKNIAKRGEVEFIAAGSPCQGFSNANQNKKSPMSLQNSSMVSSVAAFIDFYRPKYALLENVTAMASRGRKSKEVTVFSQLVCCLVAMGYQVQQFNIDAWSFGSPQSRRRLFISIAAPGLELPPYPALSHSHPVSTRNAKIGVAANGLSFGERRNVATPFKFVTAAEATKDMPLIGDAKVQTYIPYPDHRTSRVESTLTRVQASIWPTLWWLGKLTTFPDLTHSTEPETADFPHHSHTWSHGGAAKGEIYTGEASK